MRLTYVCMKCRERFKEEKKAKEHIAEGKCKGSILFGAGQFGTVMKSRGAK